MKCLVMIRVSTERQKVEDQHNEMEVFCHGEGYDEIVFVEDRGASAIKLNDSYRMMIDQVKEEIEKDPSIRCFAVWELSRAFRNEGVYYEVKQFLVERKVQFLVKNPYLKLLNPDGTVNPGMEVAVTLMTTLAKQEMELKKERFKRAKDAMRKQGKYTGGHTIKFGYTVDEGGYIVIDEEDSKLVRLIFDMYSTGKWSVRKLYDELKERGYNINYHLINRMVADSSYVDGRYPQMISQDLWDRCEAVRKRNFISIPKGRRYCFGSGIFRCSVCGNLMVADAEQYRCRKHKRYSAPPHCENNLTIRIENMDCLLWYVASREESQYQMVLDENRKKEYEDQIEVLKKKVATATAKISSLEEKKKRINELYEEGYITKEDFKKRQNKTLSEGQVYNDTILKLNEQIEGFLSLLEGSSEPEISAERLHSLFLGVYKTSDLKLMRDLVRKHIVKATAERYDFKGRKSAQLITIETMMGKVLKFVYVARKYKGHYFWQCDYDYPVACVQKIEREPSGVPDPRAFKKIKDW